MFRKTFVYVLFLSTEKNAQNCKFLNKIQIRKIKPKSNVILRYHFLNLNRNTPSIKSIAFVDHDIDISICSFHATRYFNWHFARVSLQFLLTLSSSISPWLSPIGIQNNVEMCMLHTHMHRSLSNNCLCIPYLKKLLSLSTIERRES